MPSDGRDVRDLRGFTIANTFSIRRPALQRIVDCQRPNQAPHANLAGECRMTWREWDESTAPKRPAEAVFSFSQSER